MELCLSEVTSFPSFPPLLDEGVAGPRGCLSLFFPSVRELTILFGQRQPLKKKFHPPPLFLLDKD